MNTSTNTNGALSVFLVDDDTMFLKSLEHYLTQKLKNLIKIKTFSTGESCLKNMEQKPDIVVLDYFLNGQDQHAMNGVQVLEKIKLKNKDTNVIVLSGQEQMDVAINTMKNGAFDYVVKNENAHMRMHNAIKNASKSIKMSEQLMFYKRFVLILISIITLIVTITIITQF